MNKDKIYEVIFWTSMITVLIWMFLKGIGVINTPVIIQLIPYAGGIFAFGVFFQMVKGLKDEVKDIKTDLNDVKKSQQNMAIDMSEVKTRLSHVERSIG